MGRLALGLGGLVMIVDALLSIATSTDSRRMVQAGRIFRASVGLTMSAAALLNAKDLE